MSANAEAKLARRPFGFGAWVVVAALIVGLLAGAAADALDPRVRDLATSIISTIGGLWLDALKMTVVPLVVALLINGIVGSADIAREGRVAAHAIGWFLLLYAVSALIGAVAMPLLLDAFPWSPASTEAVKALSRAVEPPGRLSPRLAR